MGSCSAAGSRLTGAARRAFEADAQRLWKTRLPAKWCGWCGGANDAEILVKWWWHGGGNGDCQSSSHSNVLPEAEEQEGNQQQKNMTV